MKRIRAAASISYLFALLATGTERVLAHGDEPHTPATLWQEWSFDPLIILSLALPGVLYGRGWSHRKHNESWWQSAVFAAGLVVLIIALISPLHVLGETLFSAHMGQHILLIAVAAPLLVLSAPVTPILKGLPRRGRGFLAGLYRVGVLQKAARLFSHPIPAWLLHVTVLYLWHVPTPFEAAVRTGWLHALEHVSLLVTALIYWAAILTPRGSKAGAYGLGVLSLFAMMMQCSLLGALMTFAPSAWYPVYATSTTAWGLSPLEDQQLAGLVMWIPAGTVYLSAAIGLGAAWFRAGERRTLLRTAFRTTNGKEPGHETR
jgi:cytochrome c oxidase assembly factor CtaG